ncbi:MAG: fasciclin domain-containing protein [Planctomycetaceae bacterium]|nr:fasciclin domain-containing protein [Planctomycetaceae bacterium]
MRVQTSVVLLLAAAACLAGTPAVFARKPQSQDIIETAVAAKSFQTLAAALTAGGLIDALKSEGPFTVFAPTDEAFAKLPAGTVESLLKPENKEKLVAILKYHVVSGKVTSEQVAKRHEVTTLNGQDLKISAGKGVRINNANVVRADIMASNGVIHVIDEVLLP